VDPSWAKRHYFGKTKRHWSDWSLDMSKLVSPEERAENLRQAIQLQVEPMEHEGAGHYWMLSTKGFARIAEAIRQAENDALERAAELCDVAHQESLVTRSKIISPDYFVIKALASRELAAAIRQLKHKGEAQSPFAV
jgi:hypothetical protein